MRPGNAQLHPALVFLLSWLLVHIQAFHLPSSQTAATAHVAPRSERPLLPRGVSLVVDTERTEPSVSSPLFGRPIYGSHVSVAFDGTSANGVDGTDGALRVEILRYRQLQDFVVRVLDFTPVNWRRPVGRTAGGTFVRTIHRVGTTTLTNAQLADQLTGKGVVPRALKRDDIYRLGWGDFYNGCISFAERLVQEVLGPSFRVADYPQLQALLDDGKEYSKHVSPPIVTKISALWYEYSASQDPTRGLSFTTEFDVSFAEPQIVGSTRHEVWFPPHVQWRTHPGGWTWYQRRWPASYIRYLWDLMLRGRQLRRHSTAW